MIFKGFEKDLILLPPVIKKSQRYEQNSTGNESGGILLGKVYPAYVAVETITTPSVFDKLGHHFFVRSKIPAQRAINRSWLNSQGQTIYLGEWHTHSENDLKPSPQDRSMIHNCLVTTEMEIDFLFLIIVGLPGSIWAGVQTKKGLFQLSQAKESQTLWV